MIFFWNDLETYFGPICFFTLGVEQASKGCFLTRRWQVDKSHHDGKSDRLKCVTFSSFF